jgi:VCBS repeat-containing protein
VAFAQPAAAQADCKPVKKKAHHHDKKDDEEEHAKAPGNDEDQNLSQPADGCVLPQSGQAAVPQESSGGTQVVDETAGAGGGGISSGLLIGAGVLAAVGVGVLALANGKDEDKNAPPVANADTATATEGATTLVSGSVATNDTDPNNDPLTFTLTGTAPAGFTLNSNGSFTFDANNAAYNSLAQGATQTLSIPYSVSDGRGGTASSTLTITVTGTNDAPVAAAVTGPAATEGGAAVTATVAGTDPDQGAVLTYSLVNPVPGVTINATTGVVTLNPADPAYNALAAGQTQQVVANVRVTDNLNLSTTTTVTFNLTGTNDVPTVVADTLAATEDAAIINGSLRTNDSDPDTGDTLTYTVVGTLPAGLTVAQDGTFSFNPANAAYQNLGAGQTRVVTANLTVTDGKSTAVPTTLTITVTGTNDAPVATAVTRSGNEDTTISGNAAATDVDANAVLTYSVVGTAPAGFVLDPATGAFTLDTRNAAYQNLTQGQVQNVVVNYQVSDGTLTSTSTITIAVTGQAETLALVEQDTNPTNRDVITLANTDFILTDDAAVPNITEVRNFTADDYILFTAPFNGDGAVSFTSGDFDNDGVADDLRITTNNGGVVSDTVLVNVVAPNALVFNEETAEAAVFGGSDNFRTTTQSTVVTASLDVDDNQNNPATLFVLPVAANTASFVYTDDVTRPNTVQVNSFGSDDVIVFNTAQANVSFTSGDFLGDGSANDLRITVNNGGVVSEITLAGAVSAGALIFNEETAEAALGPNTNNFQFSAALPPAPPPPPAGSTAVSLDQDDNSNPNDFRTFNAATGSFRFTDDADAPNNASIVGLNSDDRIVLETGNNYSFTVRANDGDNVANDLIVTLNKNGVVSEIVLKDAVVDTSVLVFNEATAERALGNIDYFSFA